jgi:hypothetical protein
VGVRFIYPALKGFLYSGNCIDNKGNQQRYSNSEFSEFVGEEVELCKQNARSKKKTSIRHNMNNYNYVNNNNTNSQLMASPMRIRAMT